MPATGFLPLTHTFIIKNQDKYPLKFEFHTGLNYIEENELEVNFFHIIASKYSWFYFIFNFDIFVRWSPISYKLFSSFRYLPQSWHVQQLKKIKLSQNYSQLQKQESPVKIVKGERFTTLETLATTQNHFHVITHMLKDEYQTTIMTSISKIRTLDNLVVIFNIWH